MRGIPALLLLLLPLVAPGSSHAHRLPPALAAAQARAAAAAEAHTAALRGGPGPLSAAAHTNGNAHQQQHMQHAQVPAEAAAPKAGQQPRTAAAALPQITADVGGLQQQRLQRRRRHLLQQAAAPEAAAGTGDAAGEQPKDARFANLTVGNVTAARENALRAALLDGYEKTVFPYTEFGPANVTVNVALHKILDVDLYGGTLKLAVWLRVEWHDPRLTWDAKKWNVTKMWFMNPQQGDTEIWEPDVTLWNAAAPILYTLSQEPFQVSSIGRVYWTRPGVFEVACNFKGLSAFPFGRVRCQLELGSWSYGPWYVNVSMQGKGYAVGGSITSGESAVWTEYKIQNVTAWRHTYPPYPCCPDESDWPVVLVEVALERQNLIYMMKVIVPQIILTAVAFSTFWLSPACGERLGLAVTVPLAVAVYDLLTFSQLPVSNKVTLVSAMGMTAFLFSMAVLLENAFVIQLWHYTEATYFKGASVLAATAVAYREQLVWVHLLGCIQQLKLELARRQLASLQAANKSVRRQKSFGKSDVLGNRWHNIVESQQAKQQQQQQQHQQQQQQQQDEHPAAPGGKTRWRSAAAVASQQQSPPPQPPSQPQQQQQQRENGKQQDEQEQQQQQQQVEQPAAPAGISRWRSAVARQQQQQEQQSHQADSTDAADTPLTAGSPPPPPHRPAAAVAAATPAAAAGTAAAAGPAAATAPQGLSEPRPASVLGRAKTNVMRELGELEAQLGVSKQQDEASDALLLRCTTKEQLRSHLHSILASPDKSLSTIQRRIAKAFLVFGEDTVCARLHATLVGAGQTEPGASDDAGSITGTGGDAVDTSPQDLHTRLAGEFNRRWQLMSLMIDHACRYLFVAVYILCMVVLTIALIVSDE